MRYFFVAFFILGVIVRFHVVICNVIDICTESRSRIYVTAGSSGFISTKNTNSFFTICRLQVVSCHSCIIVINIWLFEMNQMCTIDQKTSIHQSCRCDRLEITEPLNKIYSRKLFCSESKSATNSTELLFTYRSQTQGIGIIFVHSQQYGHPFTIEYTAKYNVHFIEVGTNPLSTLAASGTISSPFFPMQYPADFRSQYKIRCLDSSVKCAIRLIFTDHQLADQSLLEFFEEKRRIGIVTGRIFRPPLIISSGPNLSINFYANKASGFGFKANYSIVIGDIITPASKPKTACGGLVESIGGTIKMIHMTDNEDIVYDCIWIVKPVQLQPSIRTHLYSKLTTFSNMGNSTYLAIHKGLTSSHLLLQSVFQSGSNWTYGENVEHSTDIVTGFYVSLRGTFNIDSRFALSYAAFSYSHSYNLGNPTMQSTTDHDCYLITDFLCHNHRCIEGRLRCDGFDHCGDNSDEIRCIYEHNSNQKWSANEQNYYFPVLETYPNLPAGFFIAFLAAFIMIIICSLFCAIIYRTENEHNYSHLSVINQMMASADPFTAENGYIDEPPPDYDFPPNYQDVYVHSTIKNVVSESRNVQNSSIQTDLINENVVACCSSGHSARENASESPFKNVVTSKDKSCAEESPFFPIKSDNHELSVFGSSATSPTTPQSATFEFTNLLQTTNGLKSAKKGNNVEMACSSANNLMVNVSKTFCTINRPINKGPLSRSIDALCMKPSSIQHSSRKIFNPITSKNLM